MNDNYDNAKDDAAMLARLLDEGPEVRINLGESPLCRWCWRPVYRTNLTSVRRWSLVRREYPSRTFNCDARSDGEGLSRLPHEPAGAVFASITVLIANAARIALAATASPEYNQERLHVMAQLICLTAGVSEEHVPWAITAIIRKAAEADPAFRTAAADWPVTP